MSTAAAANARAAACKRFFEITATEPGHLAELSDWEVFVKNALAQVSLFINNGGDEATANAFVDQVVKPSANLGEEHGAGGDVDTGTPWTHPLYREGFRRFRELAGAPAASAAAPPSPPKRSRPMRSQSSATTSAPPPRTSSRVASKKSAPQAPAASSSARSKGKSKASSAASASRAPSPPAVPPVKKRARSTETFPVSYPPDAAMPSRTCTKCNGKEGCVLHEGMPKCDPCFLLRAGCWYTEKPAKRNYDVWYDTHKFTRAERVDSWTMYEVCMARHIRVSDIPDDILEEVGVTARSGETADQRPPTIPRPDSSSPAEESAAGSEGEVPPPPPPKNTFRPANLTPRSAAGSGTSSPRSVRSQRSFGSGFAGVVIPPRSRLASARTSTRASPTAMDVDDGPNEAPPTTGDEDNVSGPSDYPGSRDAPVDSPVSAAGPSSRDPRRPSSRNPAASSSSVGGINPADLSANLERLGAMAPSTLDANLREAHTGLVVSLSVEQRQRLLDAEVETYRGELEKSLRFDLPVEQVSEPLSTRQAVVAYHTMKFERDWCAARAFAYRELFEATSRRMQALLETDWQGENIA